MLRGSLRILFALVVLTGVLSWSLAQGTLIVAQGTDVVTLDPAKATDSPSFTVISHLYQTLFEFEADGRITPLLAESYTASSDGLVYTLNLRRGVTFHDGTPFTAEAVKFTLDRILDPATASAFRGLFTSIASVHVVDDHTVRLTLSQSFAPLIAHLSHPAGSIINPAVLAQLGESFGESAIGTGAFRFVSWQRGERLDIGRNAAYWGPAPSLDGIRYLAVPEGTTRMALVESGEAHVGVRVPPQDVARLNANPNVTVDVASGLRTVFMYFNHLKEPFTDVRVRRAINHAVNKEDIAEFIVGGQVRPSDAPIAPNIFGYTPVGTYEYDPELARQLLADAGYPNGFSTVLYSPTGRYTQDIQVTEAIQGQLAEVGITTTIETLEFSAYLAKTNEPPATNEITIAMLAWGVPTGDADYGLWFLFHSSQHAPASFNRAFYTNTMVDELLEQARADTNPSARAQFYEDAMTLIWNDAPWLFLHSESQFTAVRNEVSGLVVHPAERILAFEVTLR